MEALLNLDHTRLRFYWNKILHGCFAQLGSYIGFQIWYIKYGTVLILGPSWVKYSAFTIVRFRIVV